MTQPSQGGRRGAVFSVRVTKEERAKLEELQATGGPRALGPWLVWRALDAPAEVLPARCSSGPVLPGPGTTAPAGYYPSSGNTSAAASSPGTSAPSRGDRAGNTWPGTTAPRLILDLCAGSGAWSTPYETAGYRVVRVTLPEHDVRTFRPPRDRVHGILAAPPCAQFSLARNGHKAPRDFIRGMECVNACLRIVQQCQPEWWALENPVGKLSQWLGTPRDVWEPCDFGDPWTKRTAIWGSFVIPRRGPFVRPLGGGPPCSICDPQRRRRSWCSNGDHRAITPQGFAWAFFEANP